MICPICGQAGRSTKEDVLPNWLRRFASTESGGDNFRGIWNGAPYDDPVVPTVLVRVCDGCNGWMNQRFEIPVQHIVKLLALGESVTLTPADQGALAGWATKLAMLGALKHPEPPSEDVYRQWRRKGLPPEGSRVLVGTYGSPGVHPKLAGGILALQMTIVRRSKSASCRLTRHSAGSSCSSRGPPKGPTSSARRRWTVDWCRSGRCKGRFTGRPRKSPLPAARSFVRRHLASQLPQYFVRM